MVNAMMIPIPCKKCGRFLGRLAAGSSAQFKCPNCKALSDYEIVSLRCYNSVDAHKTIKAVRNVLRTEKV